MQGFFITATNTDRGKTLVTAALRLWLQEHGQHCLAMKPVQTGMADQQLSPDLYEIYAASCPVSRQALYNELEPLLPLLQPYCYRDPCSPHLSAERENMPTPSLEHIGHCARELQETGHHCDILLVEGAGGLYVPLSRSLLMADLAQKLRLPLILVAQSGLGAINDTCLSLMAIRQWGLPLAGFLLNSLYPEKNADNYIREDNPRIIVELSGAPYLGTLPYLPPPHSGESLLTAFKGLSGLGLLQEYLR